VSVEQVCAPGYASTGRNPGLLDKQSVSLLYLLDYPAGTGAVAAGLDLPHAVTVGEDDTATDYAGAHHDASPADDGVPHSDSNPGHPADSTDF